LPAFRSPQAMIVPAGGRSCASRRGRSRSSCCSDRR
jgi:hypothetical protein